VQHVGKSRIWEFFSLRVTGQQSILSEGAGHASAFEVSPDVIRLRSTELGKNLQRFMPAGPSSIHVIGVTEGKTEELKRATLRGAVPVFSIYVQLGI
jgi:hypothetical protein